MISSTGAYSTFLYYCAVRGIPTSRVFSSNTPSPSLSFAEAATSTPNSSPQRGGSVNPSYMGTHLKEAEEESYKAAGILPIAFFSSPPPGGLVGHGAGNESDCESEPTEEHATNGKPVPYVLLGSESRSRRAKDEGLHTFLNLLGGKRETIDSSAAETAWREFWEESGRLLSDEAKPFLEHCQNGGQQRRVLWFAPGKYALFILHLPYPAPEWTTMIADTYKHMETREEGSEMDSLHWVSLPALLGAISSQPDERVIYGVDGTPYPVFRFSVDIMRHIAQYLRAVTKGQPHTVPPPHFSSPARWSPNRAAAPQAATNSPARSYHTASRGGRPNKQRSPTSHPEASATVFQTSMLMASSSPMSANARPFYPRRPACAPSCPQEAESAE